MNAVVLGVSADSVKSHAKFRAKNGLPYNLLADEDHSLSEALGVWKEKTLFGVKYMGIERTTMVIDREGRIARIFLKVNIDGHAAEVADAVETL